MSLPKWAEDALDQIDAGIFSGDTFHDREARERLEWYMARWKREIASNTLTAEKPRFCNQAGPMGGGCKDSWHVGGNYGSHVCRNPEHHDDPKSENNDDDPYGHKGKGGVWSPAMGPCVCKVCEKERAE